MASPFIHRQPRGDILAMMWAELLVKAFSDPARGRHSARSLHVTPSPSPTVSHRHHRRKFDNERRGTVWKTNVREFTVKFGSGLLPKFQRTSPDALHIVPRR